jgi:hypothetical protein
MLKCSCLFFRYMTEALETWRVEMLKDTKSASIQNSSKLGLSNEGARMWALPLKATSTFVIYFLVIWYLFAASKVFLFFLSQLLYLGSTFSIGMLKRSLEFNWHALLEDIGLWIPVEVPHTEHDDKPENEPEGCFSSIVYILIMFYKAQHISGVKSGHFG